MRQLGIMFLKKGWDRKYKKLPVFDSTYEYLVALKSNPRAIDILKVFDSGKMKVIEHKWFKKMSFFTFALTFRVAL